MTSCKASLRIARCDLFSHDAGASQQVEARTGTETLRTLVDRCLYLVQCGVRSSARQHAYERESICHDGCSRYYVDQLSCKPSSFRCYSAPISRSTSALQPFIACNVRLHLVPTQQMCCSYCSSRYLPSIPCRRCLTCWL